MKSFRKSVLAASVSAMVIVATPPALARNRSAVAPDMAMGHAFADWFILDSTGRTFNYALLVPRIVGKVDVHKSPEARVDERSIGGIVIVNTRKRLDLKSDPIAGAVSDLYSDRSRKGDAMKNPGLSTITGRLSPREAKVDPRLSFAATSIDPFWALDRVTLTPAN